MNNSNKLLCYEYLFNKEYNEIIEYPNQHSFMLDLNYFYRAFSLFFMNQDLINQNSGSDIYCSDYAHGFT